MYISLLIIYTLVPPLALHYCLKLIYQKQDKYGWHLHYLAKYLITLSFLPILFLPGVNLALTPQSPLSLLFLVSTVAFSILGIGAAIKKNVAHIYIGGVFASLMEEILFRGVIFGLAMAVWESNLVAVTVSSLAFGIWHLKNYAWQPDKKWLVKHFLYTGLLYGPLFALLRIWTGDIYLASFWHFLTDAYVALAPKKWRWTIIGDRGDKFQDNYVAKA